MNKNIGIALLVIAIAGIGFIAFSSNTKDTPSVVETAEVAEVQNIKPASEAQSPEETSEQTTIDNEQNPTAKPGSYEAYSPEKIAKAATGDVVIFFHASWCPSCRGLNSNIEENLVSIPEELTILKADYDTETELKKKYGVTTQHTLVQVDANGDMIKKWSGGSKLENIVLQLQ